MIPDADLGFNIGKRLPPRGFIGTTAYYVLFGAYYKTGSLIFLEAKSPSGRTNLDGSLIFFVENPHRVGN